MAAVGALTNWGASAREIPARYFPRHLLMALKHTLLRQNRSAPSARAFSPDTAAHGLAHLARRPRHPDISGNRSEAFPCVPKSPSSLLSSWPVPPAMAQEQVVKISPAAPCPA